MKKNLLTSFKVTPLLKAFVLLLFIQSNLIFSQTWQWAKSGGGSGPDAGYKTCTDPAGNVFVAGGFSSSSIMIGTVTINNVGISGSDGFVAKYNSAGVLQWVQRVGGTGSESLSGICSDPAGRVYVSGYYTSPVLSISPLTWGNANAGTADVFLACLDALGSTQWIYGFGGTGGEYSGGCAYSSSISSVYIIGTYSDPKLTISTTTLNNSSATGKSDIFLARFNNSGTPVWALTTGGANSNDWGYSVACDQSGLPCIGGVFSPATITGSTVIGATTLNSVGNQDMFIAKYNTSAGFQFAKSFGSTGGGDYFTDIAVDASNGICFTGYYQGAPLIIGTATLSASGNYDAFVGKYNSASTFQWAAKLAGTGDEYGNGIDVDGNSNVYLTGSYASSVITIGTTTLSNTGSAGTNDVYVAKYNSTGIFQWANKASGNGMDNGSGIASDTYGNVYVTGSIDNITPFVGATTLSTTGSSDMFVAKIGCLTTSVTGTGTNVCTGSSATITASGSTTYSWSSTTTIGSSIVVTPTVSSNYTVWATAGGCIGTPATYSLNLLPANLGTTASLSLLCKQKAQITTTCSPSATAVAWSPSTNLSSSTVLSPTVTAGAGMTSYIVTATLSNGCVASGVSNVSTYAQTPNICMVTVDSLGNNNEIYWEKTMYPQADSFIVYREISLNTYKRIGGVSYASFSMYTDTNRSIGPANGNPNLTYYKYKLQIKDSCGNTSPMSLWHETIFIQDQLNGNFNWNSYAIELSAPPISNYNLKRRDVSTGTETLVVSTVGNLATDPSYNTFWPLSNIKWFVDAVGFSCAPTFIGPPKNNNNQIQVTKTKTKSNQSNDKIVMGIVGYDLSSVIKVYPNPANDHINIDLNGLDKTETTIEIKNMLGQLVYQTKALNQYLNINTVSISGGVYMINIIQNSKSIATKKVVVEK